MMRQERGKVEHSSGGWCGARRLRGSGTVWRWGGAVFAAWALAVSAAGQADEPAAGGATAEAVGSVATQEALAKRQQQVRTRLQRLENRMVELARLLGESEPEKAERLQLALEYAGKQRMKSRAAELSGLLETARLGEADRRQAELLADMDRLLDLLSNSLNDFERRREERRRLEEIKARMQALLDEQRAHLYRTQFLQQSNDAANGKAANGEAANGKAAEDKAANGKAADAPDADAPLRQLEQEQRATRQAARRLAQELRPEDGAAPQESRPGAQELEQAEGAMQQAADRLGQQQLPQAEQAQRDAAEQLQRALDELEKTLRQVREEERAQTLAALATRLRQMLDLEREVSAGVGAVSERELSAWTRMEELKLAEALETQRAALDACQTTLRIVRDEGTTVLVPALLERVERDMGAVVAALEERDVGVVTRAAVADVIAQLEQILQAVEREREEDQKQDAQPPPQGGQQNQGDGSALLPPSAELKLMRATQERLNEQSYTLPGPDAERSADERALGARLAERQQWLADLARRMFANQ